MAVSDLTIGGAGTTTYERFTLGFPHYWYQWPKISLRAQN